MTIPVNTIVCGDALATLRSWPDECVHCVVTSPPYWGLRDYGVDGQIGLESTFAGWLEKMVALFTEVRRVLRKDGTCWVNMGDSYATGGGRGGNPGQSPHVKQRTNKGSLRGDWNIPATMKPKDLIGQPWRLAFALQESGWYLRSDIIWHKPNPMPESVNDRPTKSHEYIFLLAKNERYFYDKLAVMQPVSGNTHARAGRARLSSYAPPGQEEHQGSLAARPGVNPKAAWKTPDGWDTGAGAHGSFHKKGREKGKVPGPNSRANVDRVPRKRKQNPSWSAATVGLVDRRNLRSVWSVGVFGFKGAHFATFPPRLIEPCILAGCPAAGIVLDPFMGAGTTALVAAKLGRQWIGIELNPKYIELANERLGLFAHMGAK